MSIGILSNVSGYDHNSSAPAVSVPDAIVFLCLESLGILAMIGNSMLLYVIAKCRYCERPSFVLISSLAVADVLHGLVTTTFFYPPIVLKMNHFSETAYRLMNVVDWTAWGITISHMSAICLDRLLAITLLHRYPIDMTVTRARRFSISTWTLFFTVNASLFFLKVCCPVVPVHEFYTFDYYVYTENSVNITTDYFTSHNVYPYVYIPLEVVTIIILAFSNPFTVFRLYGRYKRKRDVRRASSVLLRAVTCNMTELNQQPRFGRENFMNKDVKIFMQITTVTIIFFCYIFVYYLFFYIIKIDNKWLSMFNSFFYSTTHMINPVVYFSLNEEMQRQLRTMFPCLFKSNPTQGDFEGTPLLNAPSHKPSAITIPSTITNGCEAIGNTIAHVQTPDNRVLSSGYTRFEDETFTETNEKVKRYLQKVPSLTVTDYDYTAHELNPRSQTLDTHTRHSKQNNSSLNFVKRRQSYIVGSIVFDEKITEL